MYIPRIFYVSNPLLRSASLRLYPTSEDKKEGAKRGGNVIEKGRYTEEMYSPGGGYLGPTPHGIELPSRCDQSISPPSMSISSQHGPYQHLCLVPLSVSRSGRTCTIPHIPTNLYVGSCISHSASNSTVYLICIVTLWGYTHGA